MDLRINAALGRSTAIIPLPLRRWMSGHDPAGQTYVEGDCRRCEDQLQICETWDRAEVTTLMAMAASDRLCVVWRLSPYGLRRGEAGSWSGYPLRTEEPEYYNGKADATARRRAGGRADNLRDSALTRRPGSDGSFRALNCYFVVVCWSAARCCGVHPAGARPPGLVAGLNGACDGSR